MISDQTVSNFIEIVNSSPTIAEASRKLNISQFELFSMVGQLYSSGRVKEIRVK